MNKSVLKVGLIFIFLIALPALLSDTIAHATSIIIYIGKGEILIGADSRNVKKGFNADSFQYLETCKILHFDSLFCVMSGFTGSESYRFYPYQITERILSKKERFELKLFELKNELTSQLSGILKKIKTNPKSWQMVVTKEGRILDIGIIGDIDGQFGVYRLGFLLSDHDEMKIEVEEEMIPCTEFTNKFTGFGDSEASKEYIATNLSSESPELLITNAILAQCIATPITVGEPINLVRITTDSYEWIKNSNCK